MIDAASEVLNPAPPANPSSSQAWNTSVEPTELDTRSKGWRAVPFGSVKRNPMRPSCPPAQRTPLPNGTSAVAVPRKNKAGRASGAPVSSKNSARAA